MPGIGSWGRFADGWQSVFVGPNASIKEGARQISQNAAGFTDFRAPLLFYAASAVAAAPGFAGAVGEEMLGTPGSGIFRQGSWLNSGRYWRIGWGVHGQNYVFRIAGEWVNLVFRSPKIDIPIQGPPR
jgi:hypothetical protein